MARPSPAWIAAGAHDHCSDFAACRAQRHPNPYLRRSADDTVGAYAIEPNAREKERQHPEQRGELCQQPVLGETIGNLRIEGLKLHHAEIWIDARKCLARQSLHIVRGMSRLRNDCPGVKHHVLVDRPIVTGRPLHHGHEIHRVVLPAQRNSSLERHSAA